MNILPVGRSALLIEIPDAPGEHPSPVTSGSAPLSPIAVYRSLRATAPAWVTELVPAAHTVLVAFDRSLVAPSIVQEWIARTTSASGGGARAASSAGGSVPVVEISVRYDGADLAVVADLIGTSVEEVIAAHTGQLWTTAFIGFAPGFAYLTGENDRLTVPRRATPRPAVPAGSVALAAGYCGVYPRESPGGWHLIGTTSATLWDPRRTEPALLVPGTRVRFVSE